jgi:hypothetical protein
MNSRKIIGTDIAFFFALYIIMPSYFALEISSNAPLLTASRILLLLITFKYAFNKSGRIGKRIFYNRTLSGGIKTYFVLLLLTNIMFISATSEAAKEIFVILFEELCLIWIITCLINTRAKLVKCLQILVYTSGVVAILAAIGSFTSVNIFYYLNTVQREMLMASFSRMGLIRAEAGFGHAVYYGAYCAVMIPICMYFIENGQSKRWKYIVCMLLNLMGLFLANSRGSLVAFICVLAFMLITKKQKELSRYKGIIAIGIVAVIFVGTINQSVFSFASDIIQSILNIFSSDSTTIANYGTNQDGMASRIGQFSGILWTLQQSPIWGLGPNAQTRGLVSYLSSAGSWVTTNTFDMGYVGIFCQYGVAGSIGYLALFLTLAVNSFKKKNDDGSGLLKMFRYVFLTYLICLLSISQVQKLLWVLIALFICYLNIIYFEKVKNAK